MEEPGRNEDDVIVISSTDDEQENASRTHEEDEKETTSNSDNEDVQDEDEDEKVIEEGGDKEKKPGTEDEEDEDAEVEILGPPKKRKLGSLEIPLQPFIGMKFQKLFDDHQYYVGEIISGPNEVSYDGRSGEEEVAICWKVKYEADGDLEDMNLEELSEQCYMTDDASRKLEEEEDSKPKAKKLKQSKLSPYEQAKEHLCALSCMTEEEVVIALQEIKSPYDINDTIAQVYWNRDNNGIANNGTVKATVQPEESIGSSPGNGRLFMPKVGLRIRRLYGGRNYLATVTKDMRIVEESSDDGVPRQYKVWQVTYDDGDVDDMTWSELCQHCVHCPIRNSVCRGRTLQCLELFSGCGAVTQEFVKRKWAVHSIDNCPNSNAILKEDIMKIAPQDLKFIPDFLWASPPCFTYSNMSGGRHRNAGEEEYEMSPEAREHNFLFARMVEMIRFCQKKHPHLIFVIENPVGQMSKMPMMHEIEDSLGLYCATVHYCAFGRHDKKPTMLWTNDFGLYSRLQDFRCRKGRCPYYEAQSHPISCRGNGNEFNAASIPEPLCEEVAQYVDSKFYMDGISYTQAPDQIRSWRDPALRAGEGYDAPKDVLNGDVDDNGNDVPNVDVGDGDRKPFAEENNNDNLIVIDD